jgi:Flp pilus assembly protein TadD
MLKWPFAFLAVLFATLLTSSPASAAWREASSEHFVIYADDSEKDLRRFAENLERYHSAMALVTGRDVDKPSPSNRVTIFVVGNQRELRRLAGGNNRFIAGFYVPRAGGSKAFVQDIKNKGGYPHFSMTVLLHEYAHHFLISSSRFAMPRWMSEGAAEFFASASFEKDGGVLIGRPAQHRGSELAFADRVSIYELLDAELYEKNKGKGFDAFYGRSWLLYHYLTFSEERSGQLTQYWLEVLNGTAPIEAGEKVFGNLDQLEKELSAYLRQRRMSTFRLGPERLQMGEVSIRELPEGEAAMMDVRIRSQRGVDEEQAAELVIEAREIAAKYPNDPGVLTVLAETEFDAGNDDQAIAAAEKAIALDPNRANAYVQQGYALFRKAEVAEDEDAAYRAAMVPFSQLNQRENNHPLPLLYYYRSYVERGLEPSENAKAALERAAELAPFDKQLWFNAAMMQAAEGKIAIAMRSLQPLASDPHDRYLAERAQTLVSLLSQVPEGVPIMLNQAAARSQSEAAVEESGEQAKESAEQSAEEEQAVEPSEQPA